MCAFPRNIYEPVDRFVVRAPVIDGRRSLNASAYSNVAANPWQAAALNGTQRIRFPSSERLQLTARFRVRIPVPEPIRMRLTVFTYTDGRGVGRNCRKRSHAWSFGLKSLAS